MQLTDDAYGLVRLVGSLAGIVVFGSIIVRLLGSVRRYRDQRAIEEVGLAFAALGGMLAFLVGSASILNPNATGQVRFINSVILFVVVGVGVQVLAGLLARTQKRAIARARVRRERAR